LREAKYKSGAQGRAGNRKASRALLALLRSCPADMSRIVIRDRSPT
jgi:hypothetical protein